MSGLPPCDVVMKGGITSGVVYPPAIHELSSRFRFRNVGGTSAGAIAAALTAAAEHGRDTPGAGFDALARLPDWIGATSPRAGITNLHALFQAQPRTRAFFRILTVLRGRGGWKPLRGALALLWGFPLAAALGALPGIAAFWIALTRDPRTWQLGLTGTMAVALALLGALIAAGYHAFRAAQRRLPDNFYGLCLGWAPRRDGEPIQLTEWMSGLINSLAGKPEQGPPLTFGDLWRTRDPKAERDINLTMMTTNLSLGRPYRLPMEEDIFFFDPTEFQKLFPPEVVRWMEEHPSDRQNPAKFLPLRPLPAMADLPVVVATRMSLSFPGLISAVPLYCVDRTREREEDQVAERCWFSDGGISSNFPVHFFDNVLPRWPTFAINLRRFHIDDPREQRAVWMPESNLGGIQEEWNRFGSRTSKGSPGAFLKAILYSMQNWRDNLQLGMAGYRDRVVHVCLSETEGGMNLDMPGKVLQKLTERGRSAGQLLISRFADPGHEMGWDNHRWIRLRSSLSVLETALGSASRGYHHTVEGMRTYEELILRGPDEPPKSYRWSSTARRDEALEAIRKLIDLAAEWTRTAGTFEDGAPRPRSELRIVPRV